MKMDHYYNYKEMIDFLKSAQKTFPKLMTLQSIGKTSFKRDIWLATITNPETGDAESKPAFWVDGNTHASEVTGTQSAMYLIYRLLTESKKNPELQYLLDHMTFYIAPRISADGAEYFLETENEVRSSMVPWPNPPVHENFIPADMDGDGQILTMRKEDPAGAFKISTKNKKLMVQRGSADHEDGKTKYYKLYKEGQFQNYDGFSENFEEINGYDLNRQYPANYRPEGQQAGAGEYPLQLPESAALTKAFTQRNRICGHLNLHTYGGLIIRPPTNHPDENFPAHDLEVYKKIQSTGSDVSGYKGISSYHDFRYNPRDTISGTTVDWSYEHRGVYSFTIEIWDVWKQAGVTVKDDVSRYFYPQESELLNIFDWAKKNLKYEDFYQDWIPYDHPQLGRVEIGGWKTAFLFRNPPRSLLKAEMEKVFQIAITQAKSLPVVHAKSVVQEKIRDGLTKLTVIFENKGFLGTQLSEQAVKAGAVKKPRVVVKTSKKLKLISGKKSFDTVHLTGRNRFLPWHSPKGFYSRKNNNETRFEWIVEGSGEITISADFGHGGVTEVQTKID